MKRKVTLLLLLFCMLTLHAQEVYKTVKDLQIGRASCRERG